ncbi:SPFH domain-containing protein [Aliarcobacter thereius]|uniref:FtsH protease regulator HflC n=2 Tax=Aliarcobacter thereius TaxID=544718 RepID=A0A1C0B9T3_9BACT|nr:SPFH domain-containing protein [Aliarcobacter thereius]OCL92000.1 FtsH protease regulator HflC [Aliarcobacter thereius]OCL94902.1 FtsH protease regulator HflC [Aliarcobacter thereius LMG 24486]OCM00350.1 FtsH protease regulator HflC [Aliarcobacter thereius]QBF15226.1 prohibitin family protein, SPFH superfamily [Aliarcobacter thereius LMG 24486]TLS91965.1 prohibitin family protein [Aliarcobacter thereius]
MPIDNDYFKNRQQGNNNNKNSNGGNFQPPFETPEFFKNLGKKAGLLYLVIIIIGALFLFKPFVIIESGQVGIKATTGKYDKEPLNPGFHFYIPVIQKVIVVDTKVRLLTYMSTQNIGSFDQSIKNNPAINVLDSRGLPISIELTVQYNIIANGVPETIATWGPSWEDKIVNQVVGEVSRSVLGGYNAEVLPMKRNDVAESLDRLIKEKVTERSKNAVIVESVQLKEIVLPEKIKEQIEKVQIANQESERVRYEVLRAKQEAEKRAALASGEAEAKRIEAQGKADAVTIEAQAQAKANKLISQSLTPHLLQMQQIEVQGRFNDALRENKDAKIFLTPGGSTPNIWVDTKDKNRDTVLNNK